MKTNRFPSLTLLAAGLAFALSASCAEKEKADGNTPPPPPAPAAAASSARWEDIKDHGYDQRAGFFAGLKELEARVDAQLAELTARRSTMSGTTDTKAWDFAMKEMADARIYLKSTGEELSNASPETWSQQKDKVGQAWVRTQTAYANVKASTTTS